MPFLRGESRGMDKGERVWIREGLGKGLRAGSPLTRKTKGYRTWGKCRNCSSWRGAGVQDSSSSRDSHAGTATGRVGKGQEGLGG